MDTEANGSELMVLVRNLVGIQAQRLRLRSHGFKKEFDRNLDLEAKSSDLMVLIRNFVGI